MADYPFCVVEITPDYIETLRKMQGGFILMPTDTRGLKFLNRCGSGEVVNVDTRKVDDGLKRSHSQLGLYWAMCKLVSENTDVYDWNTPEKIDLQCKIACKHLTGFIYYKDQDGCEKVQLVPGSISFAELEHLKACNYFDKAFKVMAEHLQTDVEALIKEAQSRMLSN